MASLLISFLSPCFVSICFIWADLGGLCSSKTSTYILMVLLGGCGPSEGSVAFSAFVPNGLFLAYALEFRMF